MGAPRGVLGDRFIDVSIDMGAPSAALADGDAAGWHTRTGLVRGASRRGMVHVLFGDRPNLVAWLAAPAAHPPRHVLTATRPLT